MSGASSHKSSLLDNEQNVKTLWIDTFYFGIPYNILTMGNICIRTNESMRPTYFYMTLKFYFKRISRSDFKIICERSASYGLPDGKYQIEFHCNINVFDEDAKLICMQSDELRAEGTFVFIYDNDQDFSSNVLERNFEFKILVKLIEYDCIETDQLKSKEEEFRKTNPQIYNNESLLTNLCYILNIPKLEYIFRGRQMMASIKKKILFIKRTVPFAGAISKYLRSKPSSEEFNQISSYLNIVLHGQYCNTLTISDEDLIKIYTEGHYLGFKFLIDLSRDCLLYRLSLYSTSVEDPDNYGTLLFEVLKAAVHVNDGDLLHEAEIMMNNLEEQVFDFKAFSEKLRESSIESRFVLPSLRQRSKKREASTSIGIGDAAASSV